MKIAVTSIEVVSGKVILGLPNGKYAGSVISPATEKELGEFLEWANNPQTQVKHLDGTVEAL